LASYGALLLHGDESPLVALVQTSWGAIQACWVVAEACHDREGVLVQYGGGGVPSLLSKG